MNDNILVVLAFNESLNIENTIIDLYEDFDKIIVINDCSKDNTKTLVENLKTEYPNIDLINNLTNQGAGKSLQIAFDYIKNEYSESSFIVKIDGDGQFLKKDILKIKDTLIKNDVDLVKSNRFWDEGIVGEIPLIRYLGNSIASLLIKMNTGLLQINDPLNGLFGFNKNFLHKINIPNLFKKYGYPFYINSIGVIEKVNIIEINNTVRYDTGAKSQLNAFKMFVKLIIFLFIHFFKNISSKLKDSNLQVSAILDIFYLLLQIISYLSVYKLLYIRYISFDGIQSNWLLLFAILQIFSYLVFYYSKKLENYYRKRFLKITNNS